MPKQIRFGIFFILKFGILMVIEKERKMCYEGMHL